MAYLSLYRKYRPKTFDEVVGQEYITRILKNQILSQRIGHAYLFSGIRGTGKTSIAKIFARAINCMNQPDGNPCNECEVCKSIEHAGVMDIIEIDAASNRGVDEIREIREKVVYPPKVGTYKVYIIDEVHMLTKEAFNALLKTLEEPPSHVVFLLATTEPNKLPATILSRCQKFEVRPISRVMIADQLTKILNDLQVPMERDAVDFIAHRGDHSMRDALSILDQVIDLRQGDQPIGYDQVLDFLGMTDREGIFRLIKAMLTGDGRFCVTQLKTFLDKGMDPLLLIGQIIDGLREMVIIQTVGIQAAEILGLPQEEIGRIQSLLSACDPNRIFRMIDGLIEDRQKMRYSDMGAIVLEMAVLKQCMPERFQPMTEIQSIEVSEPEKAFEPSEVKESEKSNIMEEVSPEPAVVEIMPEVQEGSKAAVPEGPPEEVQDIPSSKQEIEKETEEETESDARIQPDCAALQRAIQGWANQKDFLIGDMVSRGKLVDQGNDHYVMTYIAPDENMYVSLFTKQLQLEACQALETAVGRKVHFSVAAVQRQYEAMSMFEKTAAIVGDEYASLVVKMKDTP